VREFLRHMIKRHTSWYVEEEAAQKRRGPNEPGVIEAEYVEINEDDDEQRP